MTTGAATTSYEEPQSKIVILGSSAGGLEALSDFLSAVPVTDEITYVVAQHLAPDTTSLLTDLLSRQTKLRVIVAPRQFYPEPGSVYIVPPNNDIEYSDSKFQLSAPELKIGPKPSINRLLNSIAKELDENVNTVRKPIFCAIILSGTGTDGALGLTALKAAGGITAAQDPTTAKYNGMPMAAIHARAADIVASPEELGAQISEILRHGRGDPSNSSHEEMAYYRIISFAKEITNIDLTNYKSSTVERRMIRRRDAVKAKTLDDYLEYTQRFPTEAENLIDEVLIPVTEFFRDPESFKALEKYLEKEINEGRITEDRVLRVWSAGCATGEEAYTFAILLEELLLKMQSPIRYQIFATDLDHKALAKARLGTYPVAAIGMIPVELQKRYFDMQEGDFVKIRQNIRDKITFTQHNLVQDPPFSRIDIVSCRNLLIYFNTILQTTAFDTFHYSLNRGGMLFLGRAESINDAEQFTEIDRKNKIYLKNDLYRLKKNFSQFRFLGIDSRLKREEKEIGRDKQYLADGIQILQQLFGESFILLNQNLGVRYVGSALPFDLKIKKGVYADDVSDILPDELLPELKVSVIKAKRTNEPSTPIWMTVDQSGVKKKVQLMLFPVIKTIAGAHLAKGDLVVVFTDVTNFTDRGASNELTSDEVGLVGDLQLELALARQMLQSTVEELETSNEELQAINEEMQSSNEELQSTNEELQTTNEELQSTNEELLTVNDEIVEKNIQLGTLSDDLRILKQHIDFDYVITELTGEVLSYSVTKNLIPEIERIRNIFKSNTDIDWDKFNELDSGQEFLIEIQGKKYKASRHLVDSTNVDAGVYFFKFFSR